MIKTLFVFISCLLLVSCYTNGTKPVNNDNGIGGEVYVKEITYKNHSYLEFKDNGVYGQGWVHNPDCKCFIEKYD